MTASSPDHIDGILAQWGRERPDVDVSALGLFGRLFRTAQLADGRLGRMLAQHRLEPGWFDLLAALRRSGSPYELSPTQLMRTSLLSSGGMTKRVDRLAQAGLVERRPDPADRRGILVRLTRRGKATIDRALGDHVSNEEGLLVALTSSERRTLDRLLRKLLAELEQ